MPKKITGSVDLCVEWMEKAENNCRAQGKIDSAELWKDARLNLVNLGRMLKEERAQKIGYEKVIRDLRAVTAYIREHFVEKRLYTIFEKILDEKTKESEERYKEIESLKAENEKLKKDREKDIVESGKLIIEKWRKRVEDLNVQKARIVEAGERLLRICETERAIEVDRSKFLAGFAERKPTEREE